MSWSYKIALLYIGFVVIILSLVFGAVKQDFDLVTPSYYAEELTYEARIQAQRNAQALTEHPAVALGAGSVTITFPQQLIGATGEVVMFHPQFASNDIKAPIKLDANGAMTISVAGKPLGKWRLKMTYNVGQTPYYEETVLVVQ